MGWRWRQRSWWGRKLRRRDPHQAGASPRCSGGGSARRARATTSRYAEKLFFKRRLYLVRQWRASSWQRPLPRRIAAFPPMCGTDRRIRGVMNRSRTAGGGMPFVHCRRWPLRPILASIWNPRGRTSVQVSLLACQFFQC